jgi:fusion protein PurCD
VVSSPTDEEHGQKIRSFFDGYEVFTQLNVTSAHDNNAEIDSMTEVWNRSIEPGVIITVADLGNSLGDALVASVSVPVISCPSQANAESAPTPGGAPTLMVASPEYAAPAALRALNTPRLRERLRQDILENNAKLKAL